MCHSAYLVPVYDGHLFGSEVLVQDLVQRGLSVRLQELCAGPFYKLGNAGGKLSSQLVYPVYARPKVAEILKSGVLYHSLDSSTPHSGTEGAQVRKVIVCRNLDGCVAYQFPYQGIHV